MDWTEFISLFETIIIFIIGGAIGWAAGYEVNQAKVYNTFIKPFTKKTKMVARFTGAGYDERAYLVDRPLGNEPVVVKSGKQTITKFPMEGLNKSVKNVTVGQFDLRDITQIGLEAASTVRNTIYYDENDQTTLEYREGRRIAGYQFLENEKVTRNWVSSEGVQNILINAIQWAQSRAKSDVNEDFKKLKKFLYIIAFVTVVTLVIALLNAKFGSDALNLIGSLKNSIPAVAQNATFPST